MNAIFDKTELFNKLSSLHYVIGTLLVATLYVSICNVAFTEGSFFHVSNYTVSLFGKYLCYALLALAVDLVWGFCGILSLGHGAFFALGGYAMGMYLMRQIGDRGVYGHPELPDFMVFLNWNELPWYWAGSDSPIWMVITVLALPGLLAFVFGSLAFRSRVSGVYLSIMTQALTYALMLAFFRNEMGFGGNNGLTDFKDIFGFSLQSDTTKLMLFICTSIALAFGYLVSYFIMQSKMGKVVMAIRDAENRVRFTGYQPYQYKVTIFVISAMLAGLAGALYVPQVGIINPSEFSPINSIEIVIWVAIGGRGSLYGALIGAIIVSYAKTRFTAIMPEAWLFALGGLFILVTLLLPKGIAGMAPKIYQSLQTRMTKNKESESW
ncbi:urea ABC transporter permease subunit UrtC [Pseudoalteromonas phenolica]|uniref:Amino acid ABC transporter permease n=1 Tax=Pseudoalteromonas phenolica TaxID=161398 RepID=A0A0S2K8K3_9GAMM|nr:urea ABC transporter permease subunit UrtC [Pseudoalteromonas phenolica]ALO44462.1 amino acid ABC transporter permease [Pseudoalteromonas phenolica]MBE0357480.1 urea transport system permease protein [Pseudoalteromonas phenolica O-BC30]